MNIDLILDRLDGVRKTGSDRWIAQCPAHDDASPSLSVRTVDDRLLLHCYAGCNTFDVLRAMDCTWADVMPPLPFEHRSRKAPPVPYRDVLLALRHEAFIVVISGDAMLSGTFRPDDRDRLWQAVERIEAATRRLVR